MNRCGQQRSVVAVVQLPPPTTGLSAVSQRVVEAFSARKLLFRAFNVGPPNVRNDLVRLVVRAIRTLIVAMSLLFYRFRGAKTVYMSTDSRLGLLLNCAIALIARLLGFRAFLHHHNFNFIVNHSPLMSQLIKICPIGTVHICLCADMAAKFERRYLFALRRNHAHTFVLPNGIIVDDPGFDSVGKHYNTGLTIGHLSNLTIEKGAMHFIEIFKRLRALGIEVSAVLAGPCEDSALLKTIQRLELTESSHFEWRGAVYGEAKAAFFRDVDYFLFPSAYSNEAQPLVLLEALAYGIPTISTGIGCMGCDHGKGPGKVFGIESFDDEVVSLVEEVFANWPLREATSANARKWFELHRAEGERAFEDLIRLITE